MLNEEKRIFAVLLPIALVAIFFALSVGSTIFMWVICSFFLFALIDPWMQKFMGKGINPVFLAIALVLISFALVGGIGFLVYRTSSGIVMQVISYKAAIFKFYKDATGYMTHWTQVFTHQNDPGLAENTKQVLAHGNNVGAHAASGAASGATPAAAAQSAAPAAAAANSAAGSASSSSNSLPDKEVSMGVLSGLNSVVSVLSFVVLTPLLTFFMVAERDLFAQMCSKYNQHAAGGKAIWKKVTDAITAYFVGNIILILVSFPIFVLAFGLLGVKSFVSLGLLSAILNLVPFLGFVLASVLPTLDLIMNGGHGAGIIGLISICCVTHFTIANVVTPKLLGAKLNLNATASTIALIAWGELWGPLGLLLAIPLTALIKIWLEHSGISMLEFVAGMMNEDHTASSHLRMKKTKKS
jgi:predicted PurR-regulated permease PerM